VKELLKNIKIRTKILILTSVTLFLMGLVIVFGLSQINTMSKEMSLVIDEDIPLLESVSRITYHNLGQKIHFERAIQFGRDMTEDEGAGEQFEREKSNFEKHGLAAVQEINKNMVLVKKMDQNHKACETAELIQRIDYELRAIHKELSDYRFQAERVFNLLAQGKLDKADQSIQKIMKKGKEEDCIKHDTTMENLLTAIENYVAKSIVQAQRDQQVAMVTTASFCGFVFLLSITLGYFISRSIRKPLQVAVDVTSRISAGKRDIEIAVNSKDETGLLLSTMKKMFYAIKLKEGSLIRANEKL